MVRLALDLAVEVGAQAGARASAPCGGPRLRDCRPDEVEAVLEFWKQAGATVSRTDTAEDLRRALTDSPTVVLVAERDGQVVGSVIGSFDGWRGNVYRLAVHPAYRRQGLARALVAEVERRLAGQGARRMTALVEQDHPWAMGFWQAAGYAVDPRMARLVRNLGAEASQGRNEGG
jgi:ribosomal protein S18 acetylase RimI-like enzyme